MKPLLAKEHAPVYLAAALRIHRGQDAFSCCAVTHVAKPLMYFPHVHPARKNYVRVMLQGRSTPINIFCDSPRKVRILLLCMAAAIAAEGDIP